MHAPDGPGKSQAVPRTFPADAFPTDQLVAAKAGRSISVCIPARDEAATVGAVVEAVALAHLAGAGGSGLVDEVVVVDDGSVDRTADVARRAGSRVISLLSGGGKGQAMAAGLKELEGDLVVFLDADVRNTSEAFVSGLVGPLLLHPDIALVKGFYERPVDGDPDGGGRVTQLVAQPVIELLFPELAAIHQPLAGETAARRELLETIELADDYGVEIGLLIDVARRYGVASIAQVDLGVRMHRNRPLHELRPQAIEVLRAALTRVRPSPLGE